MIDEIITEIGIRVDSLLESNENNSKEWSIGLCDSNKTLMEALSCLSNSAEMLTKLQEDSIAHVNEALQNIRGKLDGHKVEVCINNEIFYFAMIHFPSFR